MTIHFAAARVAAHSPVAKVLTIRRVETAANDNTTHTENGAMREALYHFARYGLGAAREARHRAEAAFFYSDRREYDRWIEICRILDRRMALEIERGAQR